MTTERSSFDDPGSEPGAMGDEGLGTVDAVVGTREETMTSSGLSDAPPTAGTDYDWNRGSLGTRGGAGSRAGTGSNDRVQAATSNVVDRVADTAQQQVGTTVDSQLSRGADMLGQVSNAIRRSGDELRGEQPQIASLADTAAQQVDRAGEYLRRTDFQGLVRGAEDFARRQPAVFLGGALALGLVASRFLKASPSDGRGEFGPSRYRSYGTYGRSSYGQSTYGGSSYGGGSYGSGSGMYGTTSGGSSGTQQANYGGERGTSPSDSGSAARYADAGSGATSAEGAEHGGA
jgi:hypothetical protein